MTETLEQGALAPSIHRDLRWGCVLAGKSAPELEQWGCL